MPNGLEISERAEGRLLCRLTCACSWRRRLEQRKLRFVPLRGSVHSEVLGAGAVLRRS